MDKLENLSADEKELSRRTNEQLARMRAVNIPVQEKRIRLDGTQQQKPDSAAPLVAKLQPRSLLGRGQLTQEKARNARFIKEIPGPVEQRGFMTQDTYTFNSHEEFYQYIKAHSSLNSDPHIGTYLGFIDNIGKSCGCQRRQLHDAASQQYARILPIIQADNPSWFDSLKKETGAGRITFKERDVVLLEV